MDADLIAARTGLARADRMPGRPAVFVHAATAQEFVLVPGGAFVMGMSAGELADALREVDHDHRVAAWHEAHAQVYARAALRGVVVQPFLCGRSPLLGRTAEAAGVPWSTHETSHEAGPSCAAELTRQRALDLVRQHGWALIDDAQWEHVARCGGQEVWAGGPRWRQAVEHLTHDPRFTAGSWALCNAWGVWGLALGEWVADGGIRGGGVLHAPWQDSDEAMSCHVARRGDDGAWRGLFRARPVIRLPWLESPLEPPAVPDRAPFDEVAQAVGAELESERQAAQAAAAARRAAEEARARAADARIAALQAQPLGRVERGTVRSLGEPGVYIVRLASMNGILRLPPEAPDLAVGDVIQVRVVGEGGVPELELA